MTGILDILNSDLGKSIITGVASSMITDATKTDSILAISLPVLMKAMERNAATPEGAEKLMAALSKKWNGSILDNIGSLFAGSVDKSVNQDGADVLCSILINKQKGTK